MVITQSSTHQRRHRLGTIFAHTSLTIMANLIELKHGKQIRKYTTSHTTKKNEEPNKDDRCLERTGVTKQLFLVKSNVNDVPINNSKSLIFVKAFH